MSQKKQFSLRVGLGALLSLSLLACQTAANPSSSVPVNASASPAVRASQEPVSRPSSLPSASPSAAEPVESSEKLEAQLGFKFVSVPAGSFAMGDSKDGPVHQVTLSQGFQLQNTELTQAQWQAVMGTNPSFSKGDNLPVESVSWNDIQSFLTQLNAKTQGGYRLPTEAEWEYASRAGSTTAYACGEDESCLAEMAWYIPNAKEMSHPVGQLKPNAWGLYDMHGNISEWVQDRYAPYTEGAQTQPMGPEKGDYRIQRGGHWGTYADRCRSASRQYGDPGGSDRNLGFRLARSLP
ncbi:formylglycine-generating enzyme family protein [bacterium (Candidatus Blackallbacteria) CG17_big_fil_post_rev_8_21_14_2_50_48_46]|uniref:Formylglycine-generating enzyme family protein n=1 Tax=bacterium (Candidatus Blackallbacteria) CG17_big_fil_post_rev_8_21_14_2_50_48_46 TaxID=2014261 RepID=A0A2M7G778_9BACT|nr:MAG: Sulphatase-modifying factor protein [bacterium (Candidatus Blackallbacteria) CG18_big_fil_WC_8_21_14_2_50_49_26]PIW17923.1 MAG: formylglycine-generating enzyme family protein [bacterium (Candidatus Blackallbacteria) CG17_big_fil_post_rev_8_21_14_2_50_48_46]PIW45742.1 MAG: formylglycine-generating enzyme family protein [bacterium (Candidatus Blackallbacteria) CG13_big_fil_rev_8_21_14_2_50_49_14]